MMTGNGTTGIKKEELGKLKECLVNFLKSQLVQCIEQWVILIN